MVVLTHCRGLIGIGAAAGDSTSCVMMGRIGFLDGWDRSDGDRKGRHDGGRAMELVECTQQLPPFRYILSIAHCAYRL